MPKVLFISNIARKVGSFSSSAIMSAKKLNFDFYSAANWNQATPDQIVNDEKKYGIKITQVDFERNPFNIRNVVAYKQILHIMKMESFELVHTNTPIGGVVGRLAAKKCGVKKVIYQAHGFHFYKGAPLINWLLFYTAERWLAHYTDALITINKEDYERAQKFHLRNQGKVYYVPGVGIDIAKYQGVNIQKKSISDSIGIAEDDLVLITAGRLDKNKNCGTLIRAVSLMNDEKVKLLICGDGEERLNLESLTRKLALEKQVLFLGYRSDMIDLYQISDCLVMASLREGLSRTIMEAMASGLPCIASNIRGNVDLLKDGVGGFLCEPDDITGFADAIESLSKDVNLRKDFSLANLERIKEFDISIVEKEISDIYRDILKSVQMS